MWTKFWNAGGHYLLGLAGIGATAGLIATGHVDGTAGESVISGITFGLAGIGAVTAATSSNTKPGA